VRSPTERSLKYARERDYSPGILERWTYIPVGGGAWKPHKKHDWFGFDIGCAHPTKRPLFIQTTSSSNHAARVTKLLLIPEVKMLAGWADLEVNSWGPRKKGGKEYTVGRIERLVLDAFGELVVERQPDVWATRPKPKRRKPAERSTLLRDLYG